MKKRVDKEIATTHDELKFSLEDEIFERAVKIQVGLVGPPALLDPVVANQLKITEGQHEQLVEKVRAWHRGLQQSEHLNVSNDGTKKLLEASDERFASVNSILSPEQRDWIEDAGNTANDFIEFHRERLSSVSFGLRPIE